MQVDRLEAYLQPDTCVSEEPVANLPDITLTPIPVLSIGGSDPSGGAGIQLDLKVFQVIDVHGMAVPAALTAQGPTGVSSVLAVPAKFLNAQLNRLTQDVKPAAIKTGMLYSAENVAAVAGFIQSESIRFSVVDPVLASSTGAPLLKNDAVTVLKSALLPQAFMVTPNLREAEILSGLSVKDADGMKAAAEAIWSMGPRYVVVKGGHLLGDPEDLLYDGKRFISISGHRAGGPPVHGTGCALSSAIAAYLAKGVSPEEAVRGAKRLIYDLIQKAFPLTRGGQRYMRF